MTSKDATSLVTAVSASNTSHQILLTILYFEVFSFPLSIAEIWKYSHVHRSKAEIAVAVEKLMKDGLLFEHQGFYSTQDKPAWAAQRLENMERAEQYRKRAQWAVALMRHFPFVRGILISGSLSKGVITDDGDVDYFIVTEPKRLWIARTLLVMFKKLFLLNSHRYFCVNYFVDTEHLLIEEQNRFTATEVATILPVYHSELYTKFQQENTWRTAYYPQYPMREEPVVAFRSSWIQRLGETLLRNSWGERLDIWCMKRTVRLWEKRFANLHPDRFAVALKSHRHTSKHHPQDFQNKVKQAYEDRLVDFEKRTELHLERTTALWKKI